MSRGGVIAYPTEAVWGLGCNPNDEQAVSRLLALKGRHVKKGLILVAASIRQLAPYLKQVTPAQRQQLEATWPGGVTWLVPDQTAPDWIRGEFDSVALRVSPHPLVAGLCTAFGGPVVSTSANPQGLPPAMSGMDVRRYFGSQLDGIAPGLVGNQRNPSEIRDLRTGKIVRAG